MLNQKPLVLILCTGNSCRSQMAEGFLRHYQGERYEVVSAGTAPKDAIHPLAIRVMNEVGIDIGRQRPKDMGGFLGIAPVRHLVIVCNKAQGTCPRIWPGTYSREYMPFNDPDEAQGSDAEKLAVFRRVRDEIREAMRTWEPALERAGR